MIKNTDTDQEIKDKLKVIGWTALAAVVSLLAGTSVGLSALLSVAVGSLSTMMFVIYLQVKSSEKLNLEKQRDEEN